MRTLLWVLLLSVSGETTPTPDHLMMEPSRPAETKLTQAWEETAKKALTRFSLPGGYRSKAHRATLLSLLQKHFSNDKPLSKKLIRQALLGVLYDSEADYEEVLHRFPELTLIGDAPIINKPYLPAADEEKIHQAVVRYFEKVMQGAKGPTEYSHWRRLAPLRGELDKLPDPVQQLSITDISKSMRLSAVGNPDLAGVWPSKLYYYINEQVRPLFNRTKRPLTAYSHKEVGEKEVQHFVLGTHPFSLKDGQAARQSAYGFYYHLSRTVVPPGAEIGQILDDRKLVWEHGGQEYHAAVKVTYDRCPKVIPKDSSLDYKGIWKDGRATFVVFTGASDRENGIRASGAYLDYLKELGFKFGKPKLEKDFPGTLREWIRSGKADYLIKSAHSDGDDQNIAYVDRESSFVEGTLRHGDGRVEHAIIFLANEPKVGRESTFISNREFGTWMKEREAAGGSQLVYLNSSCNSRWKAENELAAATSPILVTIPSNSNSFCFSNTKSAAQRIIIEGFRAGKDYPQIRQDLIAGNKNYREGKKSLFIFPDSETYQALIGSTVENSVFVNVDQNCPIVIRSHD